MLFRSVYRAYNETFMKGPVMLQNIDGRIVYVIVIPEGPSIFPVNDGGDSALTPYATALNTAYMMGLVMEPGKYGIEIDRVFGSWVIHKIIED